MLIFIQVHHKYNKKYAKECKRNMHGKYIDIQEVY